MNMKRINIRLLGFYSLVLFYTFASSPTLFGQTHTESLNDGWFFQREGDTNQPWQLVSLPHTWNTDAYTLKNYYRGKGIYERQFHVSGKPVHQRFFLKIDAACQSARVLVNHQLATSHRGGYSAFTADITPFLKYGEDNLLRIEVDNADAEAAPVSADFTFMGGVYRDVWLISTPMQHFELLDHGSDGIRVSTPEVSREKARVQVRSIIRNDSASQTRVTVRHELYDPQGQLVGQTTRQHRIGAHAALESAIDLPPVDHPQLWSPETPLLYRLVSILTDRQGRELQRTSHHIGMRWCAFDAQKGFSLNGEPYKLRGMCIHQDQKPYGVAMDDDMHRRDVAMMKAMGANFVRLAHEQQDNAILEACDRLGLLVWEEIPVVNSVPESEAFMQACRENLIEMVRQHYNHPSVILWGYMNEVLLQTNNLYKGDDHAKAIERILSLARQLETTLKEEDPYRHSTMALHGSEDYNRHHISGITDVVGWNLYQGWYGGDLTGFERFLAKQQQAEPTHPVIVSEWGAGSDRRLHSTQGKPFDFSIEYQQKYVEHYLPVIEEKPYICGGSYWNFIDFSSANRDESMPRINNKGVVYADRTPKDIYYYYQAKWRDDIPVIHVASRDWDVRKGFPGTMLPVKVYTNLSEVELFLNGNSLGRRTADNCFVLFDVAFSDGRNLLTAKGMHEGKVVEDATVVWYEAAASLPCVQEMAVNVGSQCYYTSPKSGVIWLPDQPYQQGGWGYVGGKQQSSQGEIHATDDGPLYQTWLEGLEAYCFDVDAGTYELELLYVSEPSGSQSSVYNLGQQAATVGRHAIHKKVVVDHGGGTLTVRFPYGDAPARLSAIKLRKK